MQRGGVHYRTPLLIPLTVGEEIQPYQPKVRPTLEES